MYLVYCNYSNAGPECQANSKCTLIIPGSTIPRTNPTTCICVKFELTSRNAINLDNTTYFCQVKRYDSPYVLFIVLFVTHSNSTIYLIKEITF